MRKILLMLLVVGSIVIAADTKWKSVDLVDSFGDKTGNKRIIYEASGKFSNVATSGSPLFVDVFVDGKNECDLIFYEYRNNSPAKSFYSTFFSFTVKDGNGEKKEFSFTTPSYSSSYIGVNNNLINILKKGGIVKVHIYTNYASTVYDFEIDANGFNDLYEKTFIKK